MGACLFGCSERDFISINFLNNMNSIMAEDINKEVVGGGNQIQGTIEEVD